MEGQVEDTLRGIGYCLLMNLFNYHKTKAHQVRKHLLLYLPSSSSGERYWVFGGGNKPQLSAHEEGRYHILRNLPIHPYYSSSVGIHNNWVSLHRQGVVGEPEDLPRHLLVQRDEGDIIYPEIFYYKLLIHKKTDMIIREESIIIWEKEQGVRGKGSIAITQRKGKGVTIIKQFLHL